MRSVVCVKQVATLGDEVEFTLDGLGVDLDYVDWSLNEWDAYAVEEALRLRERHGGEVVVVSAGGESAEGALRRALAMGADRAVHAHSDRPDPLAVAAALAGVVAAEVPDIVLTGVQSSDAVQGAVGSALAERLGLPCVAVVTQLAWTPADRIARVVRELEGGLEEVLEVDTPAVLTIQTGINEPRYATLRAIKQAEQQKIVTVEASTSGLPAYILRRMSSPPKTEGAHMLHGSPTEIAQRILELVREALQ
jgi:electron transfer flavoprotein beta subunit